MTEEQLNKRIHEIMGLCGHENISQIWNECFDCHKHDAGLTLIDFVNSWEGFGILWGFIQKHERLEEFITKYGSYAVYPIKPPYVYCLPIVLISPLAFAKAVVEFFEED